MSALILDLLVFLLLPVLLWRLLRGAVPLAVVPVLLGLGVSGVALLLGTTGPALVTPTVLGDQIGMLGVMLLAFSAGLEGRDPGHLVPDVPPPSAFGVLRTAAVALLLPFCAGSLAAWGLLLLDADWRPATVGTGLAAGAIGLCLAVSALPVLVALLRELPQAVRPLGAVAIRVAALDDMALWLGLGLLMALGRSSGAAAGLAGQFGGLDVLALAVLGALPLLGRFDPLFRWGARRGQGAVLWLASAGVLAGSAWATHQLGLHAVLGAYYAGMVLPARWAETLPEQAIGRWALLGCAPLFFGHRGLEIDPRLLTPDALGWMVGLLGVSVLSKIIALLLVPPVVGLSGRQRLTLGVLLQCKGLMEIVAATLLLKAGLVSATAYAVLVTLALVSTALTAPLVRWMQSGDDAAQRETAVVSGKADA